MKVCLLGAGVTGITTAYAFARDGHDVTVIDRHAHPAAETSFANGGQLSYSYVAPLADPSVLRKLPALLFDRASPLRFRARLDPSQWRWCLAFLAACTRAKSRQTTTELLGLGAYSRALIGELVERERLSFDYARSGKLVLYRDAQAFASARAQMAFQNRLGCDQRAVTPRECVSIEPALAAQTNRLAGGIFTESEASGDCHAFCVSLADTLRDTYGVTFRLDTTIESIRTRHDSVARIETSRGVFEADLYISCLGVGGLPLMDLPKLRVPLYPLTGYSLTVPAFTSAPRVSITDTHHKVVYATLGERLRIAGMVDIGVRGMPFAHAHVADAHVADAHVADARTAVVHDADTRAAQARLRLLLSQAEAFLPGAGAYSQAIPWSGMRPATPSGKPVIGPTPYHKLWLNTGHGALGFTLAAGTAALLADMAAGRTPACDPTAFAL
ncbi:FAD-dependent oxidoreductase [Pararobbsia silviterrae]|uniref:FAD-dependent oxidoreductase n=1 Tax=Pararobbsia silviterrae TaxID=1792498 RepID=A0A494X8K9_9BURK|nr:FAD-dependent oxidoreductase [Pararobbsia silviterrae]RKP47055.1 FAD-dependent oxidoreductase [Pararobbsia silviterrae]